MTTLDQFESVFRSAVKPQYRHKPASMERALIITDLEQEQASEFAEQVQQLLAEQRISEWEIIIGSQYSTTLDLLALVESRTTDLICCYRNLHSPAWQHPHSLGAHLDVLIQKTPSPVLVLPHPQARYAYEHAYSSDRQVLAMTDHITDDDKLVSYAAGFCGANAHLYLAHIEDEATFARYIDAISKITTIDTENAEATIRHQLLKHPRDYIDSCRAVLTSDYPSLTVDAIVSFGHHLVDYLGYVEDLGINLLVMHGKDEDQLAMHGLSYPLAIELRQIPVLII